MGVIISVAERLLDPIPLIPLVNHAEKVVYLSLNQK
jgi:hypothetical protein